MQTKINLYVNLPKEILLNSLKKDFKSGQRTSMVIFFN